MTPGGRREHPPGRPAPEPPPPPKADDLARRHPGLAAAAGLAGDDEGRRAQCVLELEIDLERMSMYDHPDPGAIQTAVEEAIESTQLYAGPQRVPYRVTGVRVLGGQIATATVTATPRPLYSDLAGPSVPPAQRARRDRLLGLLRHLPDGQTATASELLEAMSATGESDYNYGLCAGDLCQLERYGLARSVREHPKQWSAR